MTKYVLYACDINKDLHFSSFAYLGEYKTILELLDALQKSLGELEKFVICDSNHRTIVSYADDLRWTSMKGTNEQEDSELIYILNNPLSEKAADYYLRERITEYHACPKEAHCEAQTPSSADPLGAQSSAENKSFREDIMLDNYAERMDASSKPPILTLTGISFQIDDEIAS